MASPRKTVQELLLRMDKHGSYSNIVLDNTFSRDKLSERDKGFAAALFYGVLERRMTLDYIIRQYSSVEFDKIEPGVLQALRCGLYQLLYMGSVPENAAVNESVALVDISARGFVNAVLRSFVRDGKPLKINQLTREGHLSIEYSCPKWLVKKWLAQFGEKTTVELLEASMGRAPLYIKVNTYRFNRGDVMKALKAEGVACAESPLLEDCLELGRVQGIEQTAAFRKGMFHVQDISSQICCRAVKPVFNQTVLDMCAAPGGKSFTMAQMMNNRGKLIACDLYGGKVSVIEEGAKRLGLGVISSLENDAGEYNPALPEADRVLCDVPCSGLGVIRRKPEIKYKPMQSLEELPKTQAKILEASSRYVKLNGILVYSTCTLNAAENEDVVNAFQREHPEFAPMIVPVGIPGVADASVYNFLPQTTGGDGFFTAIFRRVREK